MDIDVTALGVLDRVGAVAVILMVAGGVITRRLIWYKDHAKALGDLTEDRNFWRKMALGLLGVSEKQADSSEVTARVLAALPTKDSQEQE